MSPDRTNTLRVDLAVSFKLLNFAFISGSLISDGPSKERRTATKAQRERQKHTSVSRSRRGKLNICAFISRDRKQE